MGMSEQEPLMTCSRCGVKWEDIIEIIQDPLLQVEGYQATFVEPKNGLILITHHSDNCGTTLALVVADLKCLDNSDEIFTRNNGLDGCDGLCLLENKLEDCNAPCDMAWVRHAIQWLRKHQLPPHLCK